MTSEESPPDFDRSQLSPQAITDRLHDLEKGDKLIVNDRKRVFEVVETDKYYIVATDPQGNRYTISQNLQTGGWNVNEDVWWISAIEPADCDGG